jgi:2-(1,2-epoxy-1,2-dihydrophenyl)acetyl-CoA isomerase
MVLAGSGSKFFSSGIDMASGILDEGAGISATMLSDLVPLLECMEQSRKLIIASVEGAAVGVGCSLALQCDLLVMSENASLNLTFSNLGLIADGGINWHLPRKVGYNRALQIVLEAQVLDANRCLDLGIANKVLYGDHVAQESADWARELAGRATVAQGYTKQLMRSTMAGRSLFDTVRMEAEIQAVCADTEYFKKIYADFLAK